MSTTVYLSLSEFAEVVGLRPATIRNYHVLGMLPEPDVKVAHSPGWRPTTAARWAKARGTAR